MSGTDLAAWTPVFVRMRDGVPSIDWALLDGPLREPFFEDAAQRAMAHPFNALFAQRTTIAELDDLDVPAVRPSGLIFHMSRSGSTLVAQMLAGLSSSVVLSEPQPLDALIRLRRGLPGETDESFARRFRALVSALVRPSGPAERVFVKFQAWHVVELPLIRAAFPDVPAIFLFREPRAVLQSQARVTGTELIAGAVAPALLGMERVDDLTPGEYGARVLGALCAAALRAEGRGLMQCIDYATLPAAVGGRILPSFGVTATTGEEEYAMRRAAQRDAKAPRTYQAHDEAVPSEIDRYAARWVDAAYSALRQAAG